MSTIPQVVQQRRPITLVDGTQKFEITTIVVDKGDLPFKDLFVLSISDANDPKDDVLARVATPYDIRQTDPNSPKYVKVKANDLIVIPPDTFARVANIDELTGLFRDRTAAVRNGRTEYLSSVMTVVYDTLTTADAAYKQILARLSALVEDWRAVFTPFATNPTQSYDLPVPGVSVEDERKRAYIAARNARIKAEADRDAAQAAANACESACATDKAIYDFLVADVAFLEAARTIVVNLQDTSIPPGTPLTTNVKDFVLQQGAFAGDNRSYQALLTAKKAARDEYAAKIAACSANCERLAAAVLEAQRIVDNARAAERDALSRVYEVCPTFDPNSV
jgi:hypothetical protein